MIKERRSVCDFGLFCSVSLWIHYRKIRVSCFKYIYIIAKYCFTPKRLALSSPNRDINTANARAFESTPMKMHFDCFPQRNGSIISKFISLRKTVHKWILKLFHVLMLKLIFLLWLSSTESRIYPEAHNIFWSTFEVRSGSLNG